MSDINYIYSVVKRQKNCIKGWEVTYYPYLEPKNFVVVGFFLTKRQAKQAIIYHKFKLENKPMKGHND